MTLDEAIKHCEEVAEENEHDATIWKKTKQTKEVERCEKCAADHRQLAEWLRELKKYRAIFKKIGRVLGENGYTMDDLDSIFGKVNEGVEADEK